MIFTEGAPFQEPLQVSSLNSSWATNLTVDIGTINFGWLELKRRLYNGNAQGPTITVKRGDTLKLTLVRRQQMKILYVRNVLISMFVVHILLPKTFFPNVMKVIP